MYLLCQALRWRGVEVGKGGDSRIFLVFALLTVFYAFYTLLGLGLYFVTGISGFLLMIGVGISGVMHNAERAGEELIKMFDGGKWW